MNMSLFGRALVPSTLLACISFTTPALGGWTATYLGPSGTGISAVTAVSGGQQAGSVDGRASIWAGASQTWTSLAPGGYGYSSVNDISNGQQVGSATALGTSRYHAGFWNGTAGSWTDLHPAGYYESMAYGAGEGQQVGWARASLSQYWHAALWAGSAASLVDLNPVGLYSMSHAQDAWGGTQVGWASGFATSNRTHAGTWNGTAASWTDLHPSSMYDSSLNGIWGNQYVGTVHLTQNGIYHAGLWTGTTSWLDLNPSGCTNSGAARICSGLQVGSASGSITGGQDHASLWRGSAASWQDLHNYLTPGVYTSSKAAGIEVAGNEIWVVGWATSASDGNDKAVLWHYVPEPASAVALTLALLALGVVTTVRSRQLLRG
jgi:hypothetical protein